MQTKQLIDCGFGRCWYELVQMIPLPYSQRRSSRYSDRFVWFFCYYSWAQLGLEFSAFSFTYDLNGFKSRINIHLLTVGFL